MAKLQAIGAAKQVAPAETTPNVKQRFRVTDKQGESGLNTNFNERQRMAADEKKTTEGVVDPISFSTADWFEHFGRKSLSEYAAACYGRAGIEANERGEAWHSPMYFFVWLVRGHSDFDKLLNTPRAAFDLVANIVNAWSHARFADGATEGLFGKRLALNGWVDFFDVSVADARAEFMDIWQKCRYRPGYGPLDQAKSAAIRCRLLIPPNIRDNRPVEDSKHRDRRDYEFFISVAGHLQVIMGDRPIMLPCVEVGALMEVSEMTISRYRRFGAEDGFLKIVKHHDRHKGTATEFRFDTSRYPRLDKVSQAGTVDSFLNCIGLPATKPAGRENIQ